MDEKVYIAKIGKTVGLKGQLKLHIDTDFPEQFKKNIIFITNKNISLTIENFNIKNNIIKFIGIDTIDDAKRLINQQLFSSIEDTKNNCKLDKNQYFWFDLEDCNIIENGIALGKIVDIHRYPSSDYFEIKTDSLLVENKKLATTFLLPYTPEYILDVNIQEKTIIVKDALDILEAS